MVIFVNVVVIVADSLRVDHVGCYGSSVQTPNIDELAKESTVFENAFSEGLPTLPTRTTWWTGRYTFPFRGWQQFEHSDLLLAEVLWNKGCKSALISDTYHMHKPIYNCGRGFDNVVWVRGQEYDPWIVDPHVTIDLTKYHRLRGDETDEAWRVRFEQYLRNVSWIKNEEDYFVARVVKEAVNWLENTVKNVRQKDKLFLWVDCFDPHEPFGEHGYIRKAKPFNYEYLVHIPWIIKHPDGIVKYKRVKKIVQTVDLMPTILDFLGVSREKLELPFLAPTGRMFPQDIKIASKYAKLHGHSLMPLIEGKIEKIRDYAYIGHYGRQWSIRNEE